MRPVLSPRALACLLAVLPLRAQMPAGATPVVDPPADKPRPDDPVEGRLQSARRALAAGQLDGAHAAALDALALAPRAPAVLRVLLQVSKDDGDARWLWGERLLLAVLDERGKPRIDDPTRALLPVGMPWQRLEALVAARVAAVEELAAYLKALKPTGPKTLGNAVLARHLVDLTLELGSDAPTLVRKHATLLDNVLNHFQPEPRRVVDALLTLAGSQHALAGAARRELAGILAQARYPDLKGPPPPALDDVTLPPLPDATGAPLTVDQLSQLSPAEQHEFSLRHRTWDDPARALSGERRYLIETTCGYETVLGAARVVDQVHAALAAWLGKDPFAERAGRVRIVPGHDDLESEGSPFWWAGGFQSGDQTVVRLAWGSPEDLARTLLHELTHRFDGALHAFLPAWATEGRAVWTSKAWRLGETTFVPNQLDPWSVIKAADKGYGRPERLETLLTGRNADYRDNYTAGYALWVYLSTWTVDGTPRFAEALQRFLRTARAAGDQPVDYFTSHFADGKDGRPKDLASFAAGFARFLDGCAAYSQGRAPDWLGRYALVPADKPSTDQIGDERTFSWSHTRAEPWFGDDHAARAGRLLAEAGQTEAAALALLWSLRADGAQPATCAALATALTALGRADAAWVVRSWLPDAAAAGPLPLAATLPRTAALLQALAAASRDLGGAGLPVAARALALQHGRLARALGATPAPVPELPASASTRFPRRGPAVALTALGLRDDELAGYTDLRAPDHWYEDGAGGVHVGRQRPRSQTGGLDRGSGRVDVLVRSATWQPPGVYTLRARIHPTTAYVSGSVVVGMTRRDRFVRMGFRAGDAFFASGRSDVAHMDKVELSLGGTLERESQLPGLTATHALRLPAATPHLEFELRVTVATVEVFIEDERVLCWTSPDHAPIQGYVGLAMHSGAVRVQEPTLTRLDRGPDPAPLLPPVGLDLAQQGNADPHDLLRLPTRGIPLAPDGTLVLYVPPAATAEARQKVLARTAEVLQALRPDLARAEEQPQPWLLAVSAELPEADRARLLEQARALAGVRADTRVQLITHAWSDPALRSDPTTLFVDGHGVLRAEGGVKDRGLGDWVRRWMRCYRRSDR